MERLSEPTAVEGSAHAAPVLTSGREHRILMLWSHVPHYLAACVRALLAESRVQVLLMAGKTDGQGYHVPLQAFANFRYVDMSADSLSEADLVRMVQEFTPVTAVAGCSKWGLSARLCRAAKAQGAFVLWAADHYWRGSWRDYANAALCRLGLIYTFCDAAWVPGSLGRQYARKLGFADSRILEGMLACDTELFRRLGLERFESEPRRAWPQVFLFAGQYIKRKNLGTLLAAYSMYRDSVARPWELWCAGRGPLQRQLQGVEGVRDWGYRNAAGCAELMSQAGAFVLPSWIDHWGVAVHEAACAGLPLLVSRTCGAAANLITEGYNGFTFAPHDARALCRSMQVVSEEGQALFMGRNSLSMSYQFDPRLWAQTLLAQVPSRLSGPSVVNSVASKMV